MEENKTQEVHEEKSPDLASQGQALQAQTPENKPRFTKKVKIIIAVVVSVLVLLIAGIAGAYFYQTSNKAPVEEKETVQAPTPTPDPTDGWKTYKNNEYNFKFKHPSSYVLEEKKQDNFDFWLTIKNDPNITELNPDEYFIVNITVKDIPQQTDLVSYIKSQQYINQGGQKIKIFDEVKPYSTDTLNGYYYFGGFEYMGWDIFFEKNGKVYQFSLNEEEAGIFPEPKKIEPNILDLILSTFTFDDLSTSNFTDANEMSSVDTSNWKTYTDPELNYQIKYPANNWTSIFPDKIPDANNLKRYQTLLVRTVDYDADYVLNSGAEISISAETTDQTDINSLFNNSLGVKIANNKKPITLSGIKAIQYSFSYEGTIATITEFIKDGVHYTLRYKYVSENEKSKYWNEYQEFMNSLEFAE